MIFLPYALHITCVYAVCIYITGLLSWNTETSMVRLRFFLNDIVYKEIKI